MSHRKLSLSASCLLALVCTWCLTASQALAQGISAWGLNNNGQVGNTPTSGNFKAISAGRFHSLAIRTDGSLAAWGYNSNGQVSATPTTGSYLSVAGGQFHSVAVRSDGKLISWGYDGSGQVSGTPTTGSYLAVAAGPSYSLAIRSDGAIVAWGANNNGVVSGRPTTGVYTAIAAGEFHCIALRSDGKLVSWGYNGNGQVSNTPTAGTYTAVAAGYQHSLALRSDGAVVAWGYNSNGQVSGAPTATGHLAIAAHYLGGAALRANGSIVAWGDNSNGQVSAVPAGAHTRLAGGFAHLLALKSAPSSGPPTNGLKVWLRADAGVTTSAGKVSSWSDQSGNGNTATMATAARQPTLVASALNAKPVVRFLGAQSLAFSVFPSFSRYTVLVVGKNSNPGESYGMILGPGGSSPNHQWRWENGTQVLFVGSGSPSVVTTTIGNTRAYHSLGLRFNGSALTTYRDASAFATTPYTSGSTWTIAQLGAYYSSSFLLGDLAEILIYDVALSDADLTAATSYLHTKYALPF